MLAQCRVSWGDSRLFSSKTVGYESPSGNTDVDLQGDINGRPHLTPDGRFGDKETTAKVAQSPIRHSSRHIYRPESQREKSPLSKEQIRYLLNRTIESQPSAPAMGLDKLDPALCEAQIPLQFRDAPLYIFEKQGVDFKLAHAALGLFIKRLHTRYGATQPAREIYCQNQPGRRALKSLLSSEHVGDTDVRTASSFTTLVAVGLVAENAHQHLRTWAVAPPTKRQSESAPGTHNLFSGFKIRSGIDAPSYWTSNKDPLADALKFFRFCTEESRKDERYLGLAIPGKLLWHRFQAKEAERVSVESHDWFSRALRIWTRDPAELQMNRAILALFRSQEPSPFPMLKFLRSCTDGGVHESNELVAGFLTFSSATKDAELMYWNGLRAAQQLQQRGHGSAALWILNFLAIKMPMRFERRRNSIQDRGRVISRRKITRWEQSLLSLPGGEVRSYRELAEIKPFRGLGGT